MMARKCAKMRILKLGCDQCDSMSKPNPQESSDFYSLCQQNANRFFEECEKSISQYRQSMENFQRECTQSCRKMCESSIAFQREFANKSGISSSVPEAAQKVTNNVIEAAEKAYTIQNKVSLAAIDATVQNIKALNNQANSFAEVNRNVAKLWAPQWSPKWESK